MKTIIIKTQEELDALPKSFEEFTVIEIRSDPGQTIVVKENRESSRVVARESSRVVARESSRVVARESSRVVARDSSSVVARESSRVEARDSSRVVAWDSSSVVAWDSSRVEARESSRVVAWDFSMISILSRYVIVKKLLDYTFASLRNVSDTCIEQKADTATVVKAPFSINRSFNEWLEQGYVHADGITKKLLSKKSIGEIEVFEVEEFLKRKSSYVVKRGNTFSHGQTIEKAIEDLRFKISDRDTSKFKSWKLEDEKTIDELIEAYRVITGACELGVKDFVTSRKLPHKMTIKKALKLTKDSYGNKEFGGFFETLQERS